MGKSERKSGLFVTPGDRLGVIEEFTSGSGTYVEAGTVHSNLTGRTLLDTLNKKISVYSMVHGAIVPIAGSTIIGRVASVQNKMAALRIFKIGRALLPDLFTGTLHISDSSLSYVDTMFEVCKPGDIMRARVIVHKNRTYHLSTVEKNLGVIHAFCSRCGHTLLLERRRMRCTECGKIERRKVASDYGKDDAWREKNGDQGSEEDIK
ncbi:MAG: exosome complex RNA-binding protein Csl4 [Candidatus Bathyarchaeota archaeon]|nr:MAG: exosome complex RNA-binding protein Csl4 [Candidatus Bathyarchaeota archaeon]